MGQISQIQWTDATWNVARGCTKVDEDCKYCYMYRDSFDNSRYDPKQVIKTKTVFTLPLRLKEPSKIFTSSLTDFFHEAIDGYRAEAWDIIRRCPQHTFQILTKRPERVLDLLPDDWGPCGYPNVWLGTSVGHDKARHRMGDLIDVPCAVRFVSFEPLWERIDPIHICDRQHFQWIIIGGESGNENGKYKYRPCSASWIKELIDEFKGVGSAVFVKQMGTHLAKQMGLRDRHGGNIDEWPIEFQVREFPDRREPVLKATGC